MSKLHKFIWFNHIIYHHNKKNTCQPHSYCIEKPCSKRCYFLRNNICSNRTKNCHCKYISQNSKHGFFCTSFYQMSTCIEHNFKRTISIRTYCTKKNSCHAELPYQSKRNRNIYHSFQNRLISRFLIMPCCANNRQSRNPYILHKNN